MRYFADLAQEKVCLWVCIKFAFRPIQRQLVSIVFSDTQYIFVSLTYFVDPKAPWTCQDVSFVFHIRAPAVSFFLCIRGLGCANQFEIRHFDIDLRFHPRKLVNTQSNNVQ